MIHVRALELPPHMASHEIDQFQQGEPRQNNIIQCKPVGCMYIVHAIYIIYKHE